MSEELEEEHRMKGRPVVRGSARLNGRRAEVVDGGWSRIIAAAMNPDFQAVLAFCLIGFLIALNLMLRFPDFGALIEQYNQF